MKINTEEVAWDSAGDLVVYPGCEPGPDLRGGGYDWRPNTSFDARLHITGVERGHSAARFKLETNHGIKLVMFMADMLRLVQSARTHPIKPDGWVEGEWVIVKRGANYGVTPVLPDDTLPRIDW